MQFLADGFPIFFDPMLTFKEAYEACEREGHFLRFQRDLLQKTPLYVQHYNEQQIIMPTPQMWKEFKFCDEFQRVLPCPITRTEQSCDELRGFRVYSILMTDGDTLLAQKMFTKDQMLLLMVQTCNIDDAMKQLRQSPQALTVFNRCFSVRPVPNDVSDDDQLIQWLSLPLLVTTFHFIYSVHLNRERYVESIQ